MPVYLLQEAHADKYMGSAWYNYAERLVLLVRRGMTAGSSASCSDWCRDYTNRYTVLQYVSADGVHYIVHV